MTIRWGIIGCGDVTEVKSGPGFRNAVGSRLVMVMRRNGHLAEDYARRHGVDRWTTDADTLIRDPEVDAVYVATPPGSHLEYALRAAAAGKPAYVEKPMARNLTEARQMVCAFADAGIPLFVAYYRRCLPRFITAKELVHSGRLGQVTMLTYRYADARLSCAEPGQPGWRVLAEQSGGGLFLDLASHALDIFDFILGPIENACGAAANLASRHEVEDAVAMHWRFADGAMGAATWNFASAAAEDRVEITGTEGRLCLSVFGNPLVQIETRHGVESLEIANPVHIQQPMIQSIVDQLHGRGNCPSTGETAVRTSRVMDQVLSDYYGGRDDNFWNRPKTWPGRPKRH